MDVQDSDVKKLLEYPRVALIRALLQSGAALRSEHGLDIQRVAQTYLRDYPISEQLSDVKAVWISEQHSDVRRSHGYSSDFPILLSVCIAGTILVTLGFPRVAQISESRWDIQVTVEIEAAL